MCVPEGLRYFVGAWHSGVVWWVWCGVVVCGGGVVVLVVCGENVSMIKRSLYAMCI